MTATPAEDDWRAAVAVAATLPPRPPAELSARFDAAGVGAEWLAAAVYGPREVGPPPAVVLAELAAAMGTGPTVRRLERALVFGCLRSGGGWAGRWERAVMGLVASVERVIARTVDWTRVKLDPDGRYTQPTRREVTACARLLGEVLAADRCMLCAAKWEDLRLENLATALAHCDRHHRLSCWDGSGPLDDFLARAAEHGRPAVPPESRVNDLRRGMLAKVVGEARLFAGYVLRCPDCGGEVTAANLCDRCRRPARVAEPRRWWLWFDGQRVEFACRNCKDCQAYYFPAADGRCPAGHENWSKRDFRVWVRYRVGPLPPDPPDIDRPDAGRLRAAVAERFAAGTGDQRLATALFLDGLPPDQAAAEVGLGYPSPAFAAAAQRVARELLDLFPGMEGTP